jgi:hypothetical protein
MKNNLMRLLVFLAGTVIIFGGCSGSGSDDEPAVVVPVTVELSGTVATGAPLDTAVVTAVNTQGQSAGPVNVNPDGTYTLSVNEGAPYLLKAYSQPDDVTLFSYSAGNTLANITPLTNLALFVAAGLDSDLGGLYNTWQTNPIAESDVTTATRLVNANFVDLCDANHVDAGTYNFFETPFSTDGAGIDGVLDALEIAIDPEAPTIDTMINIAVSGETNIIFDPYADISEFYLIDRITPAAAYETLSSGDALLVCSYDNGACQEILLENTLLKSELEQQMNALPKSQAIIFY